MSDPFVGVIEGRLVAAPRLDEVTLERGSVEGYNNPGNTFVVTLLYDTGAEISHLVVGDDVTFYGTSMGSPALQDQFPPARNPHRMKAFAWSVVWMSRPPPRDWRSRIKPKEPPVPEGPVSDYDPFRRPPMMNVQKSIESQTPFPPVAETPLWEPAPGSAKPVRTDIGISGTLVRDAAASSLELEGVNVSVIDRGELVLLEGQSLTVDFAPEFPLRHLQKADQVRLVATVIGYPQPHLRNTDWAARGTVTALVWTSRPAP